MSAPLTPLTHGVYAVDDTLGAAFIGFAASCVVYGVLSTQVYSYYERYPADRIQYKILAAALWVFSTADQCFIGHVVYHYSVTNYADPTALFAKPVWSLTLQVIFGSVIGATVKFAFAIRVWRFSGHNYWIAGFLILLTFVQLGFAIVYTVKGFALPNLLDLPSLKIIASLSLGTGVLTDILTAGFLCYYLNKLRTGYSKSDSTVSTLTRYAVNCGILTSAFSLATLITYDFMPGKFVFMTFYFIMSKLYAVSFLATLNTRTLIRGRGTDNEQAKSTFIMYDTGTRPDFRPDIFVAGGGGNSREVLDIVKMKVDVHREVSFPDGIHGIQQVPNMSYENSW